MSGCGVCGSIIRAKCRRKDCPAWQRDEDEVIPAQPVSEESQLAVAQELNVTLLAENDKLKEQIFLLEKRREYDVLQMTNADRQKYHDDVRHLTAQIRTANIARRRAMEELSYVVLFAAAFEDAVK